jgi:hypothetical protein
MMKSEIRISKLETNSKQKRETLLAAWVDMGFMFVAFEFGAFDIVSRFGFRLPLPKRLCAGRCFGFF